MTILIWIVRLLVLVILIRIVVRLLSSGSRIAAGPRGPAGKPVERLGGALVRDPHCGTYVPKSRALAVGSGEATQYFCSAACRDAHLDADRFARAGHAR